MIYNLKLRKKERNGLVEAKKGESKRDRCVCKKNDKISGDFMFV